MQFGLFQILFFIAFAITALMILATGGFVFSQVIRHFSRTAKMTDALLDEAQNADRKRTALDVVAQLPPGAAAHKCRNCGATVDSTAELSADGRVRCNYCNQWTSIYQ